jgi:hypothetical protein
MSLAATIRSGLKSADKLTASLQVQVDHYPWIGTGSQGQPLFPTSPVKRKVIVEYHQRLRRLVGGQEVMQQAVIIIPRPVKPHGADDRSEPIDSRDKIVFPDGTWFPILDVEGVLDPKTGRAYAYFIVLGAKATL